jgi:phosphoribosylaminoimidazole (AIR) synthetase
MEKDIMLLTAYTCVLKYLFFYTKIRVLAQSGLSLKDVLPGNENESVTLGAALMAPTVIYVKQVLSVLL